VLHASSLYSFTERGNLCKVNGDISKVSGFINNHFTAKFTRESTSKDLQNSLRFDRVIATSLVIPFLGYCVYTLAKAEVLWFDTSVSD